MNPTVTILLVASLVAASCALVGTFLVLRKMALLGDAISHAVLPGIVIAFIMTGDRSTLPMVLGAGAFGVITVFLVELFNRTRRLQEDASIGVVFPALFSLGVILVSRFTAQVDLDLDCVLYGEIAYAPWDLLEWRGRPIGAKALWVNGGVLVLVVAFITAFFKELKLTTFDAGLAAALGLTPTLIHYLLMSAVSVTVVGAFESVGAILVVAMLVVPPATAYLLTDRLSTLLALAVGFGLLSAWSGYALARWQDASIAGAMASMAGLLFIVTFLVSPRYGLLAQAWRHRRLSQAMQEQLLMLHLQHGTGTALSGLGQRFSWPKARLRATVARLTDRGWIEADDAGFRLTETGNEAVERGGQGELRHPVSA